MTMMKALASSVVIAALALATPDTSRADLGDELRGMLGNNVQVNSAGAISTARRGGFYGGSVYIRGKVMNVNVINFTPPSFAAGCGGIDLFGGSFSMINKEQFVQLLRSIAQNAAGYAFHLALKNICEQCSTIISGLQRAIQEMNQFTGNSCQLAKGIVNSGIQALELSDVKGMQGETIQQGFNDAWEGFWGSLGSSIDSLTAENPDGSSTYEDKFEVNVVWAAMRENSMSGWFQEGDNDLMEALMTLTGTVILSGPTEDEAGKPSRDVTPAVAGGGISVRDIIYGNDNAQFLNCSDSQDCLNMSITSRNLQGLEEMLEEEVIGSGPSDPNSVLFKLINGSGAPSDGAKLIGELGTYGSMLLKLAEDSPPGSTAPYEFFREIKEYLAYELAVRFVADAITAVDQAVSSNKYETAYADDWRRNEFRTAIMRINSDLQVIAEQTPAPRDAINTFIQMHNYVVLQHSPFGE